jgi:hypothetical protein
MNQVVTEQKDSEVSLHCKFSLRNAMRPFRIAEEIEVAIKLRKSTHLNKNPLHIRPDSFLDAQ